MVKFGQEKPLLDYHSSALKFLLLDRKLFKSCQKFYLLCWHNALCFPVPIIMPKIVPA